MIHWEEARELGLDANRLLTRFYVEAPPVPVEMMARQMGMRMYDDPEPVGGFELYIGPASYAGRPAILGLDPTMSPSKRRECIAEAIGHLLLDPLNRRDGTGTYKRGPRTAAMARAFADDLLVPMWMLYFREDPRRDAAELARTFQVTQQTIIRRLFEL